MKVPRERRTMAALSMSCRPAFRLLCGMFLVMALLDAPVAGWPETERLVGVLFLLGALAGVAVRLRRRGRTEVPLECAASPERRGNLSVAQIQSAARAPGASVRG